MNTKKVVCEIICIAWNVVLKTSRLIKRKRVFLYKMNLTLKRRDGKLKPYFKAWVWHQMLRWVRGIKKYHVHRPPIMALMLAWKLSYSFLHVSLHFCYQVPCTACEKLVILIFRYSICRSGCSLISPLYFLFRFIRWSLQKTKIPK